MKYTRQGHSVIRNAAISIRDAGRAQLVLFPVFVVMSFLPVYSQSQSDTIGDIKLALVQRVSKDDSLNSQEKSNILDSLFREFVAQGDICNELWARTLQSSELENLGMLDSALTNLYYVNNKYRDDCGLELLTTQYVVFTNVLLSYRYYEQVDSIGAIVYALVDSTVIDDNDYFGIITNVGISRVMQGDIEGAAAAFRDVLSRADEAGNALYTQKSLVNLGALKGMSKDLDSAYYFLAQAAGKAKEANDSESLFTLLINMSNIHQDRKEYSAAMALLDSAEALNTGNISLENKGNLIDQRAYVYASMDQYKTAYDTLRSYIKLYEEYLDEERMQAVAEMREKYESERKARQIQQLELEKLDQEVETQRIKNTRNRVMFLGGGILILAFGLWGRLRLVRRSREELRKEKEVSENLLLNILPSSVAEELKLTGKASGQYFESATIMFSDFRNFTGLAEELDAEELVNAINTYFKKFDEIGAKYGLEKIKTIGDSYMAAGGLPAGNTATSADVVKAALEMQEFVIGLKNSKTNTSKATFEMRIGIHAGPVVAGIVGVKKFQYDLWGDTVNIASRMETTGEVDKVNISEAVYNEIKDHPEFHFEPRGKIHAKGKGELEMYFVTSSLNPG